jgi:ATP-dependent Lhr-like helicase
LEGEGFAMQGHFTPRYAGVLACWRARTLAYRSGARAGCSREFIATLLIACAKRFEPVSAADFMRFLFVWQKIAPEHRVEGPQSVAAVLDQLEGFEAPAGSWESEILPAGSAITIQPGSMRSASPAN